MTKPDLKEVNPIDKNKTTEPQQDAKTRHIVEAAQLAIRSHNLRKDIAGIKKELTETDKRIGELAFILMTIEQMEMQNSEIKSGTDNDKQKAAK